MRAEVWEEPFEVPDVGGKQCGLEIGRVEELCEGDVVFGFGMGGDPGAFDDAVGVFEVGVGGFRR